MGVNSGSKHRYMGTPSDQWRIPRVRKAKSSEGVAVKFFGGRNPLEQPLLKRPMLQKQIRV